MNIQELRDAHYNATVEKIEFLHQHLLKVRLRPDGERLEYEPGQYTIVALGAWEDRYDGPSEVEDEKQREKLIKRAYSVSCTMLNESQELVACSDYDYVEFYITLVPRKDLEIPKRPPLTPRIFALQTGDRVHLSRNVVGHYNLSDVEPHHNVIFAATGTGEAPHNAMVAELLKREHQGRIASMTCIRFVGDAGYLEEQQTLIMRYKNYQYRLYTTREKINIDPQAIGYVGKQYLQEYILPDKFKDQFGWQPDPKNTHVFLCGNPDMIGIPKKNKSGELEFPPTVGMVQRLVEQGFEPDQPKQPGNIHFEKYW